MVRNPRHLIKNGEMTKNHPRYSLCPYKPCILGLVKVKQDNESELPKK
jgi:hypothetical protein